ncbi:CDK11B family protein [Megaselia abdita]
MSGSEEDGQLRSPVELSFDEEGGDTDSLDIKPPQAHRRSNDRFKDTRKTKKHSKDRKQQKYDRYYDNQNNDRYYEKPEYKKDYRKHNAFAPQQQHPQQQLQQHHPQYDNYQFHKKKHHSGHYDRQMDRQQQKQKMYQMSDEEFLQQNRRKFETQYKNSTEVLEQDLRSRLLSKRNKHENNDYAHHIPADYEVIDKRRDRRSPEHKKQRHHHHHREKNQAIEVIDSPETHQYEEDEEMMNIEVEEEPRRHHKKSKKQKHHKHEKSGRIKEEPEDPELVSRRSKLLLAEKEILKSKEAAEARRKEKATHEPAAPPKEVRKRHYSSGEEEEEDEEELGKSSKKKHRKHKKQSTQPEREESDEVSDENVEEDESEVSSTEEDSSSSSSSSSDESEKSKEVAESSPLSISHLEKSPKGRIDRSSSHHSRSSRSRSLSPGKSRSRSRSRSEEREMNKAFAEEKAKELQKDVAMEVVKEDSEEEEIPYFPGIQGCRSVEEFACLNRIEEGTYGVVYRAKDKRTNEIVALKRLKMEREKEGFPITSLREINTLLKGQHPNIVTVREIVVGSNMDKIFIVMDYVEHDLKSLMETMKNKGQNFLPGEVKCLIKQLLQAIGHLHDNWILHRDLKTSNLLLSHKGILKVGDFGLAREYGSPLKHYTSLVVTLWYRAPELLLCTKEYSTPIDMWSVGCIFAEFMLMGALFPGKSEIDQLNKIFKELGTPNEKIWPGYKELPAVKDIMSQNSQFADYPVSSIRKKFFDKTTDIGVKLLQGLLTYDPKQRFTAEKALKHDYFDELPLAIDPSMFPTWPAKSELGARKVANTSPKPPSGGSQFKNLSNDEFAKKDGPTSQAPQTFILHGGVDDRQRSMGFQLKF